MPGTWRAGSRRLAFTRYSASSRLLIGGLPLSGEQFFVNDYSADFAQAIVSLSRNALHQRPPRNVTLRPVRRHYLLRESAPEFKTSRQEVMANHAR